MSIHLLLKIQQDVRAGGLCPNAGTTNEGLDDNPWPLTVQKYSPIFYVVWSNTSKSHSPDT